MRRAIRIIVGGALLALVAGCSPATLLNAVSSRDATVSHAQYGPGARNGIDIYTPPNSRGAPVIVFFYGGNWETGDKAMYRFVGASLSARGYVVVIPDYRVYPQVRFTGFMQDGARAVAWTKHNIARLGGDPNRMFLMGHSAGAHITAMLTLDGHWLADVGLNSRRDIAGLIGLAGPYDFLPLRDAKLKAIFSDVDLARTQPINFVSGHEPPAFLAAGRADTTVDPGNTTRLAARLRAKGDDVTTMLYPNVEHAELIGAVAPVLKPIAPVADDIDRFIRAHTRKAAQR